MDTWIGCQTLLALLVVFFPIFLFLKKTLFSSEGLKGDSWTRVQLAGALASSIECWKEKELQLFDRKDKQTGGLKSTAATSLEVWQQGAAGGLKSWNPGVHECLSTLKLVDQRRTASYLLQLNWSELKWTELIRTELNWSELSWAEMNWARQNWTNRTKPNQTEPNRSEPNWNEQN